MTSTTVTFKAVGDVALYENIEAMMIEAGYDWPFAHVQHILKESDILFGNMESVFLPADHPARASQTKVPGLVTLSDNPAPFAESLKNAGFTIMNLAANHVLDVGTTGMFHTQRTLENTGIKTAGVGETQSSARKPAFIEKNGIRFAFLCYCEDNNYTVSTLGPGPAYYETNAIIADIESVRSSVDIVVVSIHADLEFMETPSVPRRSAARRIAESGADIILMHHPHVPQGIEMHQGTLIAYSLGNFVFNAHTSNYMKSNGVWTGKSFILEMTVGKSGVQKFSRVPFIINPPPEQRPIPAAGTDERDLLAYFNSLDAMLQNDSIVEKNWLAAAERTFIAHIQNIVNAEDPSLALKKVLPRLLFTAEDVSFVQALTDRARGVYESARRQDALHQRPLDILNEEAAR